MAGSLSETELAEYHETGYLCPRRIFSESKAARLRAELERLETTTSPEPGRPIAEYLRVNAHIALDMPLQLGQDPRILDQVESILGPDILLWSAEFFIKSANSPHIVSWHQDITYWGMGETEDEVSAWIALSPATPDSGCMRFVPGSHKNAIVPHTDTFADDNLLSRGQEITVDVQEKDAVDAALQPGEMSLHNGRLFHASGPNRTDDRRIGLVFRYIRPDAPATGKGKDYAVLVRGADRLGRRINVRPPMGDFTQEKLALYEEMIAGQAPTLAAGAEESIQFYDRSKAQVQPQ